MKDFTASSKPTKGSGRKGKQDRKKNRSKPSVYSSKHVRQQQAKSENSKPKPKEATKKKNKNKQKKNRRS